MFRGLINDAKSAAGSLVAKYLARASVAMSFVVALGFVTAAVTLMLIERFGAVRACWMIGGGFTAIGLVATLLVTVKEQEEEIAEKQAESEDTAGVATDAAAQAAAQAPLALLGALFASPGGPSALAGAARMLTSNIPLVVLLVLIGMLFWPAEPAPAEHEADVDVRKPNGMHPPPSHDAHREAA
jgi:hypothetical protein